MKDLFSRRASRLLLLYEIADILNEAGNITSVLGAARNDAGGKPLFDFLSLTEDDMLVAMQYIREAGQEVSRVLSGYLCDDVPPEPDEPDSTGKIGFGLSLPGDLPARVIPVVDGCVRNFLVYYLVYNWLLLKKPDEAAVYYDKAAGYLRDIPPLLHSRQQIVRRQYKLY